MAGEIKVNSIVKLRNDLGDPEPKVFGVVNALIGTGAERSAEVIWNTGAVSVKMLWLLVEASEELEREVEKANVEVGE